MRVWVSVFMVGRKCCLLIYASEGSDNSMASLVSFDEVWTKPARTEESDVSLLHFDFWLLPWKLHEKLLRSRRNNLKFSNNNFMLIICWSRPMRFCQNFAHAILINYEEKRRRSSILWPRLWVHSLFLANDRQRRRNSTLLQAADEISKSSRSQHGAAECLWLRRRKVEGYNLK